MSHRVLRFWLAALLGCLACTSTSTIGTVPGVGEHSPHVYRSDFDSVFDASVRVVQELGWQVMSTDRQTGVIGAQTPASFFVMGTNVSVHLTRGTDGIRVDVSSGLQQQIVDFGATGKNVESFYRNLDRSLAAQRG